MTQRERGKTGGFLAGGSGRGSTYSSSFIEAMMRFLGGVDGMACALDSEHRVVAWSGGGEGAEGFTGYPRRETENKRVEDLEMWWGDDDVDRLSRFLEAKREGGSEAPTLRVRAKDGRMLWVEPSLVALDASEERDGRAEKTPEEEPNAGLFLLRLQDRSSIRKHQETVALIDGCLKAIPRKGALGEMLAEMVEVFWERFACGRVQICLRDESTGMVYSSVKGTLPDEPPPCRCRQQTSQGRGVSLSFCTGDPGEGVDCRCCLAGAHPLELELDKDESVDPGVGASLSSPGAPSTLKKGVDGPLPSSTTTARQKVQDCRCACVAECKEAFWRGGFVDETIPDSGDHQRRFPPCSSNPSPGQTEFRFPLVWQNGCLGWVFLTSEHLWEKHWWLPEVMRVLSSRLGMALHRVLEKAAQDRESQKLQSSLRVLLDSIPESALLMDTQGTVLTSNKEVARRLGCSRARMDGMSFYELLEDDVAKERRRWAAKVLASGEAVTFRDWRKGRLIKNVLSPIFDEQGEVSQLVVLGLDVTEQVATIEALEEGRRRYHDLFEALPAPTMVIQKEQIGFANAAAQELFHLNAEPTAESPVALSVLEEGLERESFSAFESRYQELMGGREVAPLEIRLKGRVPSMRILETRWAHISYKGADAALVIGVDVTERKRAHERIATYEWKTRSLASRLTVTEERERRRLSCELHDNIGQLLMALKMNIGTLRYLNTKEEMVRGLEGSLEIVGEIVQSTRTLSFELSPPGLYDLGLDDSLQWLVETLGEKMGLRIHFNSVGRPVAIGADLRAFLFRSAREFLNNVHKHAGVEEAHLTVRWMPRTVKLTVRDEGKGFDAPQRHTSSGFGLFSIAQHAGFFGGDLTVNSLPGEGTTLTLEIEIGKQHADPLQLKAPPKTPLP